MSSAHVYGKVHMFQEKDIIEVIWVEKEGYSGNQETQLLLMQFSTYYCFGFLLCKTGMILTKET